MDTAKLVELNKRYWQDMYDICEGTAVKPWECVKFKITSLDDQQEVDTFTDFGATKGAWVHALTPKEVFTVGSVFVMFDSDILDFSSTPDGGEWIFAAGVVEDKPAFPRDRLYHKGTRTAFTAGERLVNPGDCSWEKPKKPKKIKCSAEWSDTVAKWDRIVTNVGKTGDIDGIYKIIDSDDIYI